MRQSRPPHPRSPEDSLEAFAASLKKSDLSPRTVEAYRFDVVGFLTWARTVNSSGLSWKQLSTFELATYRQHLVSKEGLKPATVNRRLHALRRFCRWAHGLSALAEDPSEEVKTIRTGRRAQPRGLLDPEVHALLRAAGQSGRGLARRNYALVQLMLQTGLRVGEVAALKRADLVVYERSGFVRVRDGKGRKYREVPLNATARRALTLYWNSLDSVKPEAPLFASERTRPLSLRSIQATVSELARRAHLRRLPVSAHTLRHYAEHRIMPSRFGEWKAG